MVAAAKLAGLKPRPPSPSTEGQGKGKRAISVPPRLTLFVAADRNCHGDCRISLQQAMIVGFSGSV